MSSNLTESVSDYYTNKLENFGVSPKGVDWNGAESQEIRFEKLSLIYRDLDNFSVCDLGCGYGAMYSHLESKAKDFQYVGVDISEAMLTAAKENLKNKTNTFFSQYINDIIPVDYVVASGIFNVKLDFSIKHWEEYIIETIADMNDASTKGFAFNCLTSHSDVTHMKEKLYYGNPAFFLSHVLDNYSKNVTLLHDYGLYEFTVLVRK